MKSYLVRQYLLQIPSNKVLTYKLLAQKCKTSPRAVARILASNTQQNLYPCYKVICSDGTLGGYNLGIDEKIRRLEADGIPVKNNTVEKKYFWIIGSEKSTSHHIDN